MGRGAGFSLTEKAALGLFFIQRYRFLTIDQHAKASGQTRSSSADQLRALELAGFLGHFGNTGLAGMGKTPKAYFLTRKGWGFLRREGGIPDELIGPYKETKVEARWSPQMYHRLRTVDLMIAAGPGPDHSARAPTRRYWDRVLEFAPCESERSFLLGSVPGREWVQAGANSPLTKWVFGPRSDITASNPHAGAASAMREAHGTEAKVQLFRAIPTSTTSVDVNLDMPERHWYRILTDSGGEDD